MVGGLVVKGKTVGWEELLGIRDDHIWQVFGGKFETQLSFQKALEI